MRHRGRSQTVSFRLSGKALEELERRAEEFKISPGEYSRAAIDGHLNNGESRQIHQLIEALAEQREKAVRHGERSHGLRGLSVCGSASTQGTLKSPFASRAQLRSPDSSPIRGRQCFSILLKFRAAISDRSSAAAANDRRK